MSLKIYSGLKFNYKDIYDLHVNIDNDLSSVKDITQKINICNLSKEIIKSYIYSVLCDIDNDFHKYINYLDFFDLSTNSINVKSKSLSKFDILDYLSQSTIVFSAAENPFYSKFNTSLCLSVFPLQDKIIGYHNSNNKIVSELIKMTPSISDYYYQNSSLDTPEFISESDWLERREDWEGKIYLSPFKKPFNYQVISFDNVFSDFIDFFYRPNILDLNNVINLKLDDLFIECCTEFSLFKNISNNNLYNSFEHYRDFKIKSKREDCEFFNESYRYINDKIPFESWINLLNFILNEEKPA